MTGRLYGFKAVNDYTPPATTGRLYGLAVKSTPLPTCEAGLDRLNVEPGESVSFTATSPDSPTSWSWRQVSGPTVTLDQDGATATVTAPYTLDGATIVLGVTCTNSAGTSAEDTVQVVTMRATDFIATDAGWVPVEISTLV